MKKFISLCIVSLWIVSVSAQSKLSGLVIDEQTGNFLPNASVVVIELNFMISADIDGTYTFRDLNPGKYHVVVSYIGYKTDSAIVNLGKKSDKYIVTKLSKTVIDISEVPVVASRTGKGYCVPASIDVITKKHFQELPVVSVDDVLLLVP